jgi:hypothetical protein
LVISSTPSADASDISPKPATAYLPFGAATYGVGFVATVVTGPLVATVVVDDDGGAVATLVGDAVAGIVASVDGEPPPPVGSPPPPPCGTVGGSLTKVEVVVSALGTVVVEVVVVVVVVDEVVVDEVVVGTGFIVVI